MKLAMPGHSAAIAGEHRKLFLLVFGGLALFGLAATALFLKDKYVYGALLLAAPLGVVIISSPRLALYQFVFGLFFKVSLLSGSSLTLMDLSGALLIGAGAIDFFLGKDEDSAPPLAKHIFLLIIILFIAAFHAYNTSLALIHPTKTCFVFGVFLALVRLLRYLKVETILKLFLWLSVAHATIALAEYALSGGIARSFAFAPKALDDILMLSLPLAVHFSLNASRRSFLAYALGAVLILGGLLASQSRAPIAFGLFGAMLVILIAQRQIRRNRQSAGSESQALIRRRIRLITLAVALTVIAIIALKAEILGRVADRFAEFLDPHPSGTFRLRLTLWKAALMAFSDNPLLGVGPSNFRLLDVIYTSYRLDPAHLWVQGLSAHSLLLHYMAETGIVGATALMALMIQQLRLARKRWLQDGFAKGMNVSLGMFVVAIILLLTTIVESAWMWGHVSFVAMFFLAVISQNERHNSHLQN